MSTSTERLQLRRQALITKSHTERMLLISHGQQLKQSLGFAEIGVRVAGKLIHRPIFGLGVLLAGFVITPRRIFPLLKKGLAAWQIWQLVAPSLYRMKNNTPTQKD